MQCFSVHFWIALAIIVIVFLADNGVVQGGRLGTDGKISLVIAVPLTRNGTNIPDPGWVQLAAALLAIDHFNTRDASVVPELANLQCGNNISFGDIHVLDTGHGEGHLDLKEFQMLQQQKQSSGAEFDLQSSLPDAIAGPYNEIPALELSVMATTLRIPIVAHRSFDSNLLLPERHPYFSQVCADPFSEMAFVSSYLNYTGRNNYIAIVYEATASIMQKVDILRVILDQKFSNLQLRTFMFHSHEVGYQVPGTSIRNALEGVKETGFRTIVLMTEDLLQFMHSIDSAASDLGLDQGEHMWVAAGGVAQAKTEEYLVLLNNSTTANKFFRGAAYLSPYDGFFKLGPTKIQQSSFAYQKKYSFNRNKTFADGVESFQAAFLRQNTTFLERLDALNPIPNYHDWSYAAHEQFPMFAISDTINTFWLGAGYIYDATMAIGIGACKAAAAAAAAPIGTIITGDMHLAGIRSVDFTGATGQVLFGGPVPGSRQARTIPFAVVNMLPIGQNDTLVQLTDIRDPITGDFFSIAPFVYANGSMSPPMLLRDTPEQNYLDKNIRAGGLAVMTLSLLVVVASLTWIVCHRKHSVVIAAQPLFLYALCFGSTALVFNILLISFDESYGWDETMLDRGCIAVSWLNCYGMLTVYGALFTKEWRVNRLMLQKEKKISMLELMWPITVLALVLFGLLMYWSTSGYYGWDRVEIDEVTGESVGQCKYSVMAHGLLLASAIIPVILAGVMAYKTLGIDDMYSEAKWVLIFLLVQIQLGIFAVPVLYILRDLSTEGWYIGETILFGLIPVSTMGLMVLPKAIKVRKMQRDADARDTDGDSSLSLPQLPSGDNVNEEETRVFSTPESSSFTRRSSSNTPRIQIVTFDEIGNTNT